ncbi:hypothetical protein AB8Z38_01295 [Bradyrhizobium sp. LLZ17]|uniref:Bacteriocin n=1 Tax=Bradyrhizobium sp. LLZ17 TaxID=3239388 RepID=A0AB39XL29_9BRAD
MDKQQRDVTELELTLEDLNEVNGGVRNNQTEAWAAFAGGILKGFIEAGGHPSCQFG